MEERKKANQRQRNRKDDEEKHRVHDREATKRVDNSDRYEQQYCFISTFDPWSQPKDEALKLIPLLGITNILSSSSRGLCCTFNIVNTQANGPS